MTSDGTAFTDHDGTLVRPYLVTGGRTRPDGEALALETLVVTTQRGSIRAGSRRFEQRHVLTMCSDPLSIAEVAAELEVPAGVARVLIGDLVDEGLLRTVVSADTNEQVIRRLIDGVRAL
ncbi:hypothetical protein BH23ACT10_BH23ACT10_26840 [soil metagenome]